MAKEKDYNKRTLVSPEDEIPTHKKKSVATSKSSVEKRSSHKHDYERVIIQSSFQEDTYYWGKRCKICGRVDDRDKFKASASKGLVKKTVKVEMSDSSTYYFKVFYSTAELKNLFPGVPILCYNRETREYVDFAVRLNI
jgi:hypothetical protein